MRLGFYVEVVDTQWFGNYLPKSSQINLVQKSVRDLGVLDLESINTVIHLANISNDPSVELNPSLSWETNVLDLMHLLEICKQVRVQDFLYASSGSVYGVKDEDKVTEELSLFPISLYNKTKMIAERVLMSYESYFRCIAIRPATVCGFSPRMRLDVLINMFVWQAFSSGNIHVLGGEQVRPNIHIDDLCDVYVHLLQNPGIASGAYNAGFENISILDAAKLVATVIPSQIQRKPSNDPRSYRQDSTKLMLTGYSPKRNVSQAVLEIAEKLQKGELVDNENWHTVKRMKTLGIGD